MRILPNSKLKDYIKERATEEQLFAYFLKTTVSNVVKCINYKYKLNNPFRNDIHASLSIFKCLDGNETKIRVFDWANKKYRGDLYDLVGILIKEDATTGSGFISICKYIIKILPYLEEDTTTSLISEHAIHEINVNVRDFEQFDMRFWNSYKLSNKVIQKNIIPLEYVTLDEKQCYVFKRSDPGYGYYLGNYRDVRLYQLYFPKRTKKEVRFVTNNIYPLMKIENMKNGKTLFITKSVKDVLCCELLIGYIKDHSNTTPFSLWGNVQQVDITALASESIRLDNRVTTFLQNKYDTIYINCDYDTAGIQSMKYYKNNFGFKPFVTGSRTYKDIASLVKNNTITNTIKILYGANAVDKK